MKSLPGDVPEEVYEKEGAVMHKLTSLANASKEVIRQIGDDITPKPPSIGDD